MKMKRDVYQKVKQIITNSMNEAKAFDDINVKPEHIILAMLIDDDNE